MKIAKWHKYKNGFDYYNPSHHRIYQIWFDMKRRCYQPQNKRFHRYGGRGIKVCDEWFDFQNFFDWALANGYKDVLTLDRKNADGDYCPDNCRWADVYTQANNRSNNHYVTYKGQTMTLMQWSKLLGINYSTLRDRIRKGWNVESAFNRPLGRWLNDSK